MKRTASDFLVERLRAWNVRRVFGYPGDGINGVLGALRRADGPIRFIQARHEEEAALMACAHAKFTGETGVCLATSGPGAVHLLNGLYDAKKDHQPVVALVGQQPRASLGTDFHQELDLMALFKDVAGAYLQMAGSAAQIRTLVDRAFRVATAERAVTCLILPNDVQEQEAVESPPRRHGSSFSGPGYRRPTIVPREADLREAAALLDEGERVAMLVGAGALGAGDDVIAVADRLDAGVAKALLGKAVIPDGLPWCTGAIGLLGTRPSDEMMRECDTLLMVGTGFPYAEFLPEEGQARAVQIDLSARMLGLRYPVDVPLHGDAGPTLRALLPHLHRERDGRWRARIEESVREWRDLLERRARLDADPVNPQRVFRELSKRLPDDCILAGDSGSGTSWLARDVDVRAGMMVSLSGGLATMGSAIPYGVAAKLAYPDRPVVALTGDGAMQMLGMSALITAAKYRHEWQDPRFVVCVLNNRDLNQVTWEQRVFNGDPRFKASQELPDVDYAAYARSLGLAGERVETPEALDAAWDAVLSADRPAVLDVVTDPDVPPLPPHVTLEQARHWASAMLRGDDGAFGTVKRTVRELAEAWIPGVGG